MLTTIRFLNDLYCKEIDMDITKLQGVSFIEVKKGDSIIKQREPIDFVFYMTEGCLYRILTTMKGDEVLIGIYYAGDFEKSLIGALSLYGNKPPYGKGMASTTSFVAKTNCEGYKIPRKVFEDYIAAHPELETQLLNFSMDEYNRLLRNYISRQEQCVANRFCQLLLEYSLPDEIGTIRSVYISNMDLAGLTGLHKVTISRIMKALKNEGIIIRDKEGIKIINVPALKIYAEGKVLEYC